MENQKMFNGWIPLNVETMPKILRYLITLKLLLRNVRFSASFWRLEESTQWIEIVDIIAYLTSLGARRPERGSSTQ